MLLEIQRDLLFINNVIISILLLFYYYNLYFIIPLNILNTISTKTMVYNFGFDTFHRFIKFDLLQSFSNAPIIISETCGANSELNLS